MSEHDSPKRRIRDRNCGRLKIVPVDMHHDRRVREHIGVPVTRSRCSGDHEPAIDTKPPNLDAPRLTGSPAHGGQVDRRVGGEGIAVNTFARLIRQNSLGFSVYVPVIVARSNTWPSIAARTSGPENEPSTGQRSKSTA